MKSPLRSLPVQRRREDPAWAWVRRAQIPIGVAALAVGGYEIADGFVLLGAHRGHRRCHGRCSGGFPASKVIRELRMAHSRVPGTSPDASNRACETEP